MREYGQILCIIILVLLSIGSLSDLKWKKVPLPVPIALFVTGIGFRLFHQELFTISLPESLIPGIGCLILSKLTGQVLGYGDSLLVLALGAACSLQEIMTIGIVATTAAGVLSLFLLTVRHKGNSYEIPFVPFLWLGYVITWRLVC